MLAYAVYYGRVADPGSVAATSSRYASASARSPDIAATPERIWRSHRCRRLAGILQMAHHQGLADSGCPSAQHVFVDLPPSACAVVLARGQSDQVPSPSISPSRAWTTARWERVGPTRPPDGGGSPARLPADLRAEPADLRAEAERGRSGPTSAVEGLTDGGRGARRLGGSRTSHGAAGVDSPGSLPGRLRPGHSRPRRAPARGRWRGCTRGARAGPNRLAVDRLRLPIGRRTRYFAFVAPEPKHVHLGWESGIWMADPDGILRGAHLKLKKVRYVTSRPGDEVPTGALVRYTREAAEL